MDGRVIADTSVWVDLFSGRETSSATALLAALDDDALLVPDLIVYETLRGFRSDQSLQAAREAFAELRIVHLGGHQLSEAAALRYRTLRRRGITIRRSIDALIASYCIDEDIPLLFDDRDFLPYVEHFGLRRVKH